jgi:hypothetical protein
VTGLNRSSISSSEKAMMKKRFLLTVGMALILLGIAELGARLLRPSGTVPHELGGELAYHALVPELQRSGAAAVAIVGSSRAREGFPAPEVAAVLNRGRAEPRRVANYALVGAIGSDAEIIVRRLLSAKTKPELIVYGLTVMELERGQGQGITKKSPFLWRISDALEARRRVGSPADEILPRAIRNSLSDQSVLFRLRPEIQEALTQPTWKKVRKALRDVITFSGEDDNPMRGGLSVWQQQAKPNRSVSVSRAHVRKYLGKEYNRSRWPDATQAERIAALVEDTKRAGVKLVLVEIPLAPILARELPSGALEEFRAIVAGIAQRQGVRFIPVDDLGEQFQQKDFLEQSHLNLKGATKFSRRVAELLLASGS